MKKTCLVLLLALGVLLGGCRGEPAIAQEDIQGETVSTAKAEPIQETFAAEETLPEPETEPAIQNDSYIQGSICLDLTKLRPEDNVWFLGGSKVYFGHYAGEPTLYRVLSLPDSQRIIDDEETLLLDCDTVLERKCFDDNFRKNDAQIKVPSEWQGSDIDAWLNGEFIGSTEILTRLERGAIVKTQMDTEEAIYTIGNWTYEDYGAQGYLFLLSAAEAKALYAENAARAKDGESTSWWVRSSFGHMGNGAGSIHGDGHICNNSITNFGVGVSPAMNIRLSAILFASPAGGENAPDEVWKLTLLDPGKTVKLAEDEPVTREATEDGSVITIPYTCEGENVTRISVLITDKDFSDTGAQVLYYGGIQPSPRGTAGKGAFLLPADLEKKVCGKDYYAYILAEDIHGQRETDYASHVCSVTIPEDSLE